MAGSRFLHFDNTLNNLKAEMLCFADFDVLPSPWQKAIGGFDMLGSGRHKIETQAGSTHLVAAKPVQSVTCKVSQRTIFFGDPSGTGRKMERVQEWSSQRLKQEQFQDSMTVRLLDQNSFAQQWKYRQKMSTKEIGQRDSKICRVADFCFAYLVASLG